MSNKILPYHTINDLPSIVSSKVRLFADDCLTLTGAEGRFRPCLPVLQNPQ